MEKRMLSFEEAFKELNRKPVRKLNEALEDDIDNLEVEIVKYPVDEFIKLICANEGDYDFEGKKAKYIYTDKEEESAQVGIEFEDGSYAVVGLNNDHFCKDYDDMVWCIKSFMNESLNEAKQNNDITKYQISEKEFLKYLNAEDPLLPDTELREIDPEGIDDTINDIEKAFNVTVDKYWETWDECCVKIKDNYYLIPLRYGALYLD